MLEKDLSQNFIEALRQNFKDSFYFACKAVFEQEFHTSWLSARIHKPYCELIGDYVHNTRVGGILPRAWLKSTISSVYYPIWRAMKDPEFTSLIVLNTFTNAVKKNYAIRGILQNNLLLRVCFPELVIPSKMTDEAIRLPLLKSSADDTFEFAGVGTQLTSRHVKLIIEDDTIAPETDSMTGLVMQPTKEQVEKAIGFHRVAHFLLTDFKKDQRVVVGTRWLQRDLLSVIKESEPEYKFFERAALELADGTPSRHGEPIYPERFDHEVLNSIENTVGPYMFSTLMLNLPLASSDMIFREDDIMHYAEQPSGLIVYTTVDPASYESDADSDPDYNVVLTTGLHVQSGRKYVLDYWRNRANPGEVIAAVIDHVKKYRPVKIGIESVAYQSTLKFWLTEALRKNRLFVGVDKIKGSRISKEQKIRGLQPLFHNHDIFIRKWMTELVDELLAFPRGAHDDIIDALAMHLELWAHTEIMIQAEDPGYSNTSPFSADNLIKELSERAMSKKGFPYDSLPYISESWRDDYAEVTRY